MRFIIRVRVVRVRFINLRARVLRVSSVLPGIGRNIIRVITLRVRVRVAGGLWTLVCRYEGS